MDTRVFCVYNLARGVFLSSKVTAADGVNEPLKILKVLVSGLGLDKESGLWICPLSAIPAVPRLFPFDLLYLDRDQRVIESEEIVPGAEFPRYRTEVASALVLVRRTIESTQTGRGDRLIIGLEEEIERQIAAADVSNPKPIVSHATSSVEKHEGFFDKNGAERGAAVSTVLREPFSSVAARVPEGPGIGQTVAAIESEGRIIDSNPVVAMAVGSRAVFLAIQEEELDPTGLDRDASPNSMGNAERPAQSEISNVTGEVDSKQVNVAIPIERPVISMTEPLVERRRNGNQGLINGQKGGVEDLFSNWVDAPTSSSEWIARNPTPGGVPAVSSALELVPSLPPNKNATGPEPAATGSDVVQPRVTSEVGNTVPKTMLVPPEPVIDSNQPEMSAQSVQSLIPATPTISQSPQATTFTVANLGMWRVSMPTALNPVATLRSSGQTRTSAPVAEKESTSKAEASAGEKAASDVMAAAEGSVAQARPLATLDALPVADFAEGSTHTRKAEEEPRSAESGALKLAEDKTAAPPSLAGQPNGDGTEASARSQRAISEFREASNTAASSVGANREKISLTELAGDTRERLSVKSADKAKSPVITEAAAAVIKNLQRQQPNAPAAKSGGSAQSVAATKKVTKGDSKAVVPTNGAAAKALPKATSGRTEANGKSQSSPLSLGTRFKRWLNPVTPVVSDRRRAYRRYVPGMVAHYYTGGAPTPHDVADISMTGFYLLTEDRWMPETMIKMTLQKPCAKGERKQSITVLSKIVRRGSDGVAAEFVMPEGLDPQSRDIQPAQATDRFTLARFI